ncbi:Arf-Gap With Dual Ph Domain-Containing Protein 1 [Manis pentadactyla]|nr:Arf-Gap With Dual Ph Domain-Containing Protein 1 [Manis pentadactyla]
MLEKRSAHPVPGKGCSFSDPSIKTLCLQQNFNRYPAFVPHPRGRQLTDLSDPTANNVLLHSRDQMMMVTLTEVADSDDWAGCGQAAKAYTKAYTKADFACEQLD